VAGTCFVLASVSLSGCKPGAPEKAPAPAPAQSPTPAAPSASGEAPASGDSLTRVTRNGLTVEFSIQRDGGPADAAVMEDEFAEIRFQVKDANTGQPVRGLNPAAWMDIGQAIQGKGGEQRECKDKVGLYLKGIVGIRPLVDLNAYYLLVMNQDPSISVIDPVVSMTGVTSLFAQVLLERPAADWARGANGRKLYVSMPRAGKVAVVNTETFKLEGTVAAGEAPTRTAVQPDGKYLWVGNDATTAAKSGVTVVDTEKQAAVASIATGRGHHEIALSTDDRYAFVTNRDSGTVSVVDVRDLKKVKDVPTGSTPISVAFSPLSRAAYVADGQAGTITAIDGGTLEKLATVTAKPGLGPLRFSQDGRWGFVVNPTENTVYVIDAAENKVAHAIPLPGKPYQVSFTRVFAYLRLIDSERVQMVNLGTLGEGKTPSVQSFPAGAAAPKMAGELAIADSISPANIEAAVFVVNPAEGFTYYYMEGMNAPMGTFQAYGKKARAGMVVDRSLKETAPGLYTSKARIPVAGHYDVAFLLDNPKMLHCFFSEVAENPASKKTSLPLAVELVDLPARVPPGTLTLTMKVAEPRTGRPVSGLADLSVFSYRAPGYDRSTVAAREIGGGLYEARVAVVPGAYYLYFGAPSRGLKNNDLPFRTVMVTPEAAAQSTSPTKAGK